MSVPASSAATRRRAAKWIALACFGLSSTPATAAEKREVPDYDGRDEKTTPGDVALWVPRVVLFPAYLVSEYVVRRPLGWLVTGAERARVPQALMSVFFLTGDRKVGWVPTFFVDFGFKPSVGLYVFWDDAFVRDNDLRLQLATWGVDWLAGSLTDRIHLTPTQDLAFRFAGIRRPDYEYYGEGPNTLQRDLSRYGEDLLEARADFTIDLGGSSEFGSSAGFRQRRFYESYLTPSILRRVERGRFDLPNGFIDGYRAGFSRLALRLDSRVGRPAPQSGVRLDLDVEQGSAPESAPLGWLRYGAIAGGFLDLNDRARVLSLSFAALFSDPLGSNPVPFTELVQLGGNQPMRGFVPGRLFGRSAAVATLGYHWPVWIWLDGKIQAAVGNVFGEHLNDFDPSLLRFSGALGAQSSGVSDNPIEFLIGFGTETFDHGTQVNALRLVFGTSRGF